MTRHVSSCCPPPRAPSRRRQNPDALYREVLLQTWVCGARKYWIVRDVSTVQPLYKNIVENHLYILITEVFLYKGGPKDLEYSEIR
jgi:hypothetical protein